MLWILHIKKIFTPAAFNDNDDDDDDREQRAGASAATAWSTLQWAY